MTSCFEGLLEYYRVRGESWHREAILRYAYKAQAIEKMKPNGGGVI